MMCYADLLRKYAEQNRQTVRATPVAGCPACDGKRLHTPEEKAHHPLMGHGTMNGRDYSYSRVEIVENRAQGAFGG